MAQTPALVFVIDPIVDFKHDPTKPTITDRQYNMYQEMFGMKMAPLVEAQKPPYKHPFLNTDTFD